VKPFIYGLGVQIIRSESLKDYEIINGDLLEDALDDCKNKRLQVYEATKDSVALNNICDPGWKVNPDYARQFLLPPPLIRPTARNQIFCNAHTACWLANVIENYPEGYWNKTVNG